MRSMPPGGDEPMAETESESEAELAGFSPVVRSWGEKEEGNLSEEVVVSVELLCYRSYALQILPH